MLGYQFKFYYQTFDKLLDLNSYNTEQFKPNAIQTNYLVLFLEIF